MIWQEELLVKTTGRGCYDVTNDVERAVSETECVAGICSVFIRHTSASLMICENADPAVLVDVESFMARLVPDGDPLFTHTQEGPDDMPAHIRSILTQTDLSIPVVDGKCALGVWQGIYLYEHRNIDHTRKLVVTILG